MVDGYNCRLVPMNSWGKLEQVVRELSGDRKQVAALQANALVTVKGWPTWDEAEGRIVSTIEQIIAPRVI